MGAEWLRVGPPEVQMWCEGSELRQHHKAPTCQFEFETATRSTRRGSMRHHCALKHGIVKEFLAEFLGTFVLVVSRFPPVDFFALCWLVDTEPMKKHCMLVVLIEACVLVVRGSCSAAAPWPRRSSAETPWENPSPCTSASRWD